MNNNDFIERVIDIYYEGSLREVLTANGHDNFDLQIESKVVAHFCMGIEDVKLSDIIGNEMLTEWLIFKRNLLKDEESKDMYYILLNIYSKLNHIN